MQSFCIQPLVTGSPVVEDFPVGLEGGIDTTVAVGHGFAGTGPLAAVFSPVRTHEKRRPPDPVQSVATQLETGPQ